MKEGEQLSDVSQETIRRRSAELGIELFETRPAFLKYQGAKPLYFDYDPHWTAAGHRVMAESLGNRIADETLVKWCGST